MTEQNRHVCEFNSKINELDKINVYTTGGRFIAFFDKLK